MNGLFFCQADFDLLTPKCGACGRDILAKSVATKCGQMFHDTCFKCSICRIQLQKFKTHCGELRCEEHMKENPIRDLVCYMCELPIRSSQVQNFSGVLVHKSCFTCGTCRNSIKIKNGQIKAILGKDEVFHCWGCLRKAVGSNIDLKDIIDRRSQVVVEDEEGSAPPKSSEKLLPRFRKFKRWLSSDKAKFNSQRSIESLRPAPEVFDLDVENSDEELEEFKNDEKELTDFLQRNDQEIVTYDKGEKIGEGSFGKVFVCRRRPDNLLMAMKQISLQDVEFLDWNGIMEPNRNPKIREMLKEAQILCKLRHSNVVKFIGAQIDKNRKSLNIFMEYVAGRSMYGHLYEFGAYSEQSVKKPVRQILSGLKYLHSKGIIHRDLKSKNILVSNRGVPKLADFGSAKIIDRTQESQVNSMLEASVHVCTPLYFPPEFVLNNVYTEKSDIWSFGCVVIEMVSAKLPWSEMKFENEWAAARYIAQENAVPQVNVSLSDCCRDFILSSLNRDPKKRPTAEELLNHPFLK
jgi:mitogen-activated protein kinase kinase kinase